MSTEQEPERTADNEEQDRESGNPGGGKGRRDEPGRTGVYPLSSSDEAGGEAEVRTEPEWGQGERGAAGYEDHGDSEVFVIPPSGESETGETDGDEQTSTPG